MKCTHCEEHCNLMRIKDPHSYDYDSDGIQFLICPHCLTVETRSTRDNKFNKKNTIKNGNQFSNRLRKRILFQLCNHYKDFESDEQRKIFIRNIMSIVKNTSDGDCIKLLSNVFELKDTKIINFFYTHKLKVEYETVSFI